MTRFLKLTNSLINISKIKKIVTYENSHYLYYNSNEISGFFLITIGTLRSNEDFTAIYKDTDPKDYQIVSEWIEKQKRTFD